jgi:hypothetical protein
MVWPMTPMTADDADDAKGRPMTPMTGEGFQNLFSVIPHFTPNWRNLFPASFRGKDYDILASLTAREFFDCPPLKESHWNGLRYLNCA